MYRKPARVPTSGRGCLPEPALLRPARAVPRSLDCKAWCGAPPKHWTRSAPRSRRVARGGRAGPVIWGSAPRHLCRRHGHVLQRKREEGRRRGEAEGVNQVGMGREPRESRDPERWVRAIVGIKAPTGSLRLPSSSPPPAPPFSPRKPFPFSSERHQRCQGVRGSCL